MIKNFISKINKVIFFLFIVNVTLPSDFYAQNLKSERILNSFQENFKNPREISYVHINKSIYIKGEMLGLTAYVFDKASTTLSTNSTNLYCTIEDKNGNRIKEDLLMLVKGITNNSIEIDSSFTTGTYVIKAYTNWMRNFDEQNYFVSSFKVIDPEITKEAITTNSDLAPEIQVLPEGGHAIYDTFNTFGIIAKDQFGQGLSLLKASIVENDKDTISTLSLNQFGIGKVLFKPKKGNNYKAVVFKDRTPFTTPIENIKKTGIGISVKQMRDKTLISVYKNNATKDRFYKVVLHNGKEINILDFKIDDKTNKDVKLIDNDLLYSGINIITVFDQNNSPLLERLIFSYNDINLNSARVSYLNKQNNDSISVRLKLKDIDINKLNSLSISILPSDTKSYYHDNNILSYTLLQPYLNGHIENPRYYFSDINEKTKYDLDLLLITQGWSSYDWDRILNNFEKPIYLFEQGISFKAKINDKKTNEYFISPLKNSKSFIVNLENNDEEFGAQALFPEENDKLSIYGLNRKGKPIKPNLYITFSPSTIPELDIEINKNLFLKNVVIKTNLYESSNFKISDDVEQLDEVIIKGKKKELTKYEKLKNASSSRVIVFDKLMRRDYPDFATWISAQGFNVVQDLGRLSIFNQRRNTLSTAPTSPMIILDGVQLLDTNVLANFRMDTIEYVEIDRNAFVMGMRGNFGIIKIKTNPRLIIEDNTNNNFSTNTTTVKFPLTFSRNKKFYTPKYQYYDSSFFKEYGVIDWLPEITPSLNGEFELRFTTPSKSGITLFIEGITNNNEFVSQKLYLSN
ncbi:hypothetical protein DFQ05_1460 [Winogradskyella wandonensis]|uniref:TonB-dependent receptor-like protein n=1 Tax=Winogradskyella wandonensis TaxID=1442586 RepID=A0A4V2PTS4_9FLAO|nr:hypothetical protein [Winogradskyella wandonensis]TCK67681.1 hypothetical protein DFQ05_1460 [Winogradskyella wandonensis]